MKEHLHPSLVRLYGGASDDDAFLYLDESYSVPDEYESGSFYILAAVKLSYGDLEGTRKTLRDISEKDYWHTTDELRTSEGQYRTVEMLKQLDSWGDKHLVSVEIPLQSGGALEQARGDCLRSLVEHIYGSARDNPPAGAHLRKAIKTS
ncbi:hypothetical protein FRC0475_00189 [Corynebacterium diphtheriae]|nr:hypothetical protein FRC0478_00007 [Corynebacterium diphtheriae]CAB0936700.1 hypothetical protein FRC0475_00189 [Corynebacterium diphtheriae]